MIIEFTGVPGSGKSTITKYFRQALFESGCKTFDSNDVLSSYVDSTLYPELHLERSWGRFIAIRAFVSMYYRHRIRSVPVQLQAPDRYQKDAVQWATGFRRARFRLKEDIRLAQQYFDFARQEDCPHCFITSEGIVHHLAAASVWGGISKPHLQNSSALGIRDIVVVHVDTPVELAHQRARKRGYPQSWPTRMIRNERIISQVFGQFSICISDCLEWASANGIRVMTVTNDENESRTRQVAYDLARHLLTVNDTK